MAEGELSEVLRILFLVYFTIHIPITLLFDIQGLLPQAFFPAAVWNLVHDWYVPQLEDYLMGERPLWFRSMIACELFIQTPLFFFFVYALIYKRNSIRIPAIIYGAHVSTTLVPILTEFVTTERIISFQNKITLILLYSPFLIIPLLILYSMSTVTQPWKEKRN